MNEDERWRAEYVAEATSPEPVYCWEHDGPNEWESRDLLHRLADKETIAKYMGPSDGANRETTRL